MGTTKPGPDDAGFSDKLWDPLRRLGDFRHAVWLLLAANLLVFLGPAWIDLFTVPTDWLPDFYQEYASARNYRAGRPIYLDHEVSMPLYLSPTPPLSRVVVRVNAHPPTSVLLSLPFAWMDYAPAFLVWNFFSLAVLIAGLGLIAWQLRLRFSPLAIVPALALIPLCAPLHEQVRQGQWNTVLLLLLVGAWAAERNDRQRLAGALIGLAVAIKLFPAFLLLFFAFRRRWAVVLWGLAALGVLTLLTASILGPGAYAEYFGTVLPRIAWFRVAWNNASLLGFLSKLFDPLPDVPLNFWWKTTPLWSSPMAVWIGYVLIAPVLIAVVLLVTTRPRAPGAAERRPDSGFRVPGPRIWRAVSGLYSKVTAICDPELRAGGGDPAGAKPHDQADRRLKGSVRVPVLFGDIRQRDRAFALATVAMLLLSPVAWEHYFLLLALPLAVIWADIPPVGSLGVKALFLSVVAAFWAGPDRFFETLGLPLGGRASPMQVLTLLSYQFYALLGLFALLVTAQVGGLGATRALGSPRAWLTIAGVLALALLSQKTYAIWSVRGLFDWIGLDYAIYAATAGVVLHSRPQDFYNQAAITNQIQAFLPYYGPQADPIKTGPSPYPVPFILPFLAISPLGPMAGFAVWTSLNVSLMLAITHGLLKGTPGGRRGFALATFAFLPVAYDLFLGQLVIPFAFGFYRAYRAFEREDDFRAGCWLGLLLIKPQFAAFPALALLWKRRWNALAGLGLVGVFLAVETVATVGSRGVRDYLAILKAFSGFRDVPSIVYPQDMINIRGVLVNLLPPSWSEADGAAVTLLLSGLLVLGLLPVWRGGWEPRSGRFAMQWLATMIVTVMAGYHSHIHAATLLVVPMMAMLARGPSPAPIAVLSAAAVFLPTYLFCVTGVPKYAGWSLICLMFSAYAWIVYDAMIQLTWTMPGRSLEARSDRSIDAPPIAKVPKG